MLYSKIFGVGLMTLATGLAAAASADEVFPVSASFSASSQDGAAIGHTKVPGDALLNLSQGRAPDAVVPSNEVLAFRVDCSSGEGSLIDFDTVGMTVLTTIANTERTDVVTGGTKGEFGIVLDFTNSGSPTFKIRDGLLMVVGKLSIGAGDCPVALKANATGIIDVTVTDNIGTDDVTAILTKGKFSTSSESIATLP